METYHYWKWSFQVQGEQGKNDPSARKKRGRRCLKVLSIFKVMCHFNIILFLFFSIFSLNFSIEKNLLTYHLQDDRGRYHCSAISQFSCRELLGDAGERFSRTRKNKNCLRGNVERSHHGVTLCFDAERWVVFDKSFLLRQLNLFSQNQLPRSFPFTSKESVSSTSNGIYFAIQLFVSRRGQFFMVPASMTDIS